MKSKAPFARAARPFPPAAASARAADLVALAAAKAEGEKRVNAAAARQQMRAGRAAADANLIKVWGREGVPEGGVGCVNDDAA